MLLRLTALRKLSQTLESTISGLIMNNIKIVPAILTDKTELLEAMIRQTEAFTDYAQIDIMDGKFVPSQSITVQDISKIKIRLRWEAHLMIMQPEKYFEDFQKAGAEKVIFHYEASPSPEEVIAVARRLKLGIGLAVNPETPISAITRLAGMVDSILFLSVNPGFYGSKFIPEVLGKITEFRKINGTAATAIDGGIKENNVRETAQTGVNMICVGSAVFMQRDPGASFRHLVSLANADQG